MLLLLILVFISLHQVASDSVQESFFRCFSSHSSQNHSNQTSNVVLTSNTSDYSFVLQSSIRNRRFLNTSTPKPEFIVTPIHTSHIQSAIICSRKHGFQIRVRSGGHDYEGLSYVADVPFVMIDLFNLRSINIDIQNGFAWVESGAILGELYCKIAEKSNLHGFPAGTLLRKYGLAADNIIDAKMVDVNGKVLTRESMGEDLFWAIRGGGGASFGVIVSWKVRLVAVPETVTVFRSVPYTTELGGTKLLQKWQNVADKLHEDIFLHAVLDVSDSSS
ncbi:hypothetical protein Q3G72_005330 [Acer saccharum]|nr:hypothetical protein Q3G72_005330 [Acer saccharum]